MEDFGELDIPLVSAPSATDPRSEQFVVSGNCPTVEIVNELSMLSEYMDVANPQADNLLSSVHLSQAESDCTYSGKNATVDIKLAFEGMLGPRGRTSASDKPFFSYPFFVAVTAPDGKILAKEVFGASMTYGTDQDTQTYYESLRQIIPIADPARGARYKVLVGFQLSQDQLNQNRAFIRRQNEAPPEPEIQEEIIFNQPPMESGTANNPESVPGSVYKAPPKTHPMDITTPME